MLELLVGVTVLDLLLVGYKKKTPVDNNNKNQHKNKVGGGGS